MEETVIRCNKDLYNDGKCFTKGKTYLVQRFIKSASGLMEAQVINDQLQAHNIGSWWRHFDIVSQ